MKKSEIYLEAARQIAQEENTFSCYAVRCATEGKAYGEYMTVLNSIDYGLYDIPEVQDYLDLMAPSSDVYTTYYVIADEFRQDIATDQELRVLLLCMMAAVTK